MKCAICGEEIKGERAKLGGGQTICKDCKEYSAMVRECEGCEKEFLATDLVRDPEYGIYCWSCIREGIEEGHVGSYMNWEEWLEECEIEGAEPTIEGYLAWHEEAWKDEPKDNPHRRMLNRMLTEEIKKAKKAA